MRVTEQGGRYVSVFNSSQAIDESKKWVQYIFTPENATRLTETTPMLYPPATEAGIEMLRASEAPAIQAYGDILFEVTYPTAEFAYNQIFNGGGIDPETCTIRETGVINPYVSVVWNSNLYARAVQQVAYQDRDPAEAAAEAHALIAEQVEVARSEMQN